MTQDEEHLKLLSIFHYIFGGMTGLFALIPIIHLTVGLILIFLSETSKKGTPPAFVGFLFVFMALLFITIGLIMATCLLFTGYFLSHRKNYNFCIVVGAIECLFMPLGTVLGVFTIIVLMRESVKELFSSPRSVPSSLKENQVPLE